MNKSFHILLGLSQSNYQEDLSSMIRCCKGTCKYTVKLEDSLLLSLHLKEEHQDDLFVCGACPGLGNFYYTPNKLKEHIKANHPGMEEVLLRQLDQQQSIKLDTMTEKREQLELSRCGY